MTRRVVIVLLFFVATAAALGRAQQTTPVPSRLPFDTFPMDFDGWRGESLPELDRNVIAALGADDLVTRLYRNDEHAEVGLYLAYYQTQRQGAAIHSPLNCLPGSGWQPL